MFERFGFIPEFTYPSMVGFYVLRGVAACLWSNKIKAGHMPIDMFLLLKMRYVSSSAT